jgi:hypothetical protein
MKSRRQDSREETVFWYAGDVIQFQGYRFKLRFDNSNTRFIFHFLVPETHKPAYEIRDRKKNPNFEKREKMKQ